MNSSNEIDLELNDGREEGRSVPWRLAKILARLHGIDLNVAVSNVCKTSLFPRTPHECRSNWFIPFRRNWSRMVSRLISAAAYTRLELNRNQRPYTPCVSIIILFERTFQWNYYESHTYARGRAHNGWAIRDLSFHCMYSVYVWYYTQYVKLC